MPEFIILITKFGFSHFLPFLTFLAIIAFLNVKFGDLDLAGANKINAKFIAALSLIAGLHVMEFAAESQNMFTFPYGDLGIETAEFVFIYLAFGFLLWAFKDAADFKKREPS